MGKPEVIAFYLPQYRPIEENDKWFGKGFTEWTSVARTKPLFKNHYQPKVPADLGFYDLRLQQVREEQARLAKEAGVSAFCYYHYWFGNKTTILEETLQEVVKCGKPDFPFCLCWANESWYKKCWNSNEGYLSQELLLEQQYPGEQDYIDHFNFLIDVFKDKRYYKVDGKLLFVIYNLTDFKKGNINEFIACWQKLAKLNGLPEFLFVSYSTNEKEVLSEEHNKFDMTILSLFKSPVAGKNGNIVKRRYNSIVSIISSSFRHSFGALDYENIYHQFSSTLFTIEHVCPVLVPNWDNSPRRGAGATIYYNSTPELFKKHTLEVFELIKGKKNKLVFLKSWNEWGEGNYMEPDLKYGKGYIEALKSCIDNFED